MKKFKMYILVKESLAPGKAIVAVAHASLACYLKYQNTQTVKDWLNLGPFYKVVCKVSDAEFEAAKGFDDHIVITESTLDNMEVALAFKPRPEFPKAFKFYRLWC